MRIDNISRRDVLKGMAGLSGLVLGAYLAPGRSAFAADANAASVVLEPNLFVSIAEDGVVTIVAHRSEMGQGARTSLPMLVADELEADWSRVKIVQATGDPKYGSQNTDGSRSIRRHYTSMRQMGAVARHMLEAAAAQTWGVDASECEARNHQVAHKSSGKTLDFGALVKTASMLPAPKPEAVTLKDPKLFRYIGKDMQIVDMADITHGRAIYGIDVVVPGMKYVSLERCPVLFGKPKSYDASAALSVPGVEKVVEIPSVTPPAAFKAWGGIAVVASNTWAAQEGRKKLKIEWDLGPNASYDSPSYQAALIETSRKPGDVMRQEGDVDTALADAAKVVEAEYYIPHASHAQMEPPCAVAKFRRRQAGNLGADTAPASGPQNPGWRPGHSRGEYHRQHHAAWRRLWAQVESRLHGRGGAVVARSRRAGEAHLVARGRYSPRLLSLGQRPIYAGGSGRRRQDHVVAAPHGVSPPSARRLRPRPSRPIGGRNGYGFCGHAVRHSQHPAGKRRGGRRTCALAGCAR